MTEQEQQGAPGGQENSFGSGLEGGGQSDVQGALVSEGHTEYEGQRAEGEDRTSTIDNRALGSSGIEAVDRSAGLDDGNRIRDDNLAYDMAVAEGEPRDEAIEQRRRAEDYAKHSQLYMQDAGSEADPIERAVLEYDADDSAKSSAELLAKATETDRQANVAGEFAGRDALELRHYTKEFPKSREHVEANQQDKIQKWANILEKNTPSSACVEYWKIHNPDLDPTSAVDLATTEYLTEEIRDKFAAVKAAIKSGLLNDESYLDGDYVEDARIVVDYETNSKGDEPGIPESLSLPSMTTLIGNYEELNHLPLRSTPADVMRNKIEGIDQYKEAKQFSKVHDIHGPRWGSHLSEYVDYDSPEARSLRLDQVVDTYLDMVEQNPHGSRAISVWTIKYASYRELLRAVIDGTAAQNEYPPWHPAFYIPKPLPN